MTLRNEIQQFTERLVRLEEKVSDMLTNHLPHLAEELKEIKQKVNGRPSWAVAVLITTLASLVVGMAVAMIR